MASSLQKIETDDSVLLRVTHSNIKTFSADIRFSLQMSVESVKEKLWKKCGTSVNSMQLELYDDTNYKISDLTDDSRPLGFYSPLDGFRLHVIDLDPSSVTSGGWLEDTSLVEKYKISEEAYNKREGIFPPLLNLKCMHINGHLFNVPLELNSSLQLDRYFSLLINSEPFKCKYFNTTAGQIMTMLGKSSHSLF